MKIIMIFSSKKSSKCDPKRKLPVRPIKSKQARESFRAKNTYEDPYTEGEPTRGIPAGHAVLAGEFGLQQVRSWVEDRSGSGCGRELGPSFCFCKTRRSNSSSGYPSSLLWNFDAFRLILIKFNNYARWVWGFSAGNRGRVSDFISISYVRFNYDKLQLVLIDQLQELIYELSILNSFSGIPRCSSIPNQDHSLLQWSVFSIWICTKNPREDR